MIETLIILSCLAPRRSSMMSRTSNGPAGTRSTFCISQFTPWAIPQPPQPRHSSSSQTAPTTPHPHAPSGLTINDNSTHYLHPQYILALPHSPPKTHLHLHLYILRNLSPNLKPSIALLSFTPPAGMPWVRPVGPHVLHETVVQLFRSTVPDEASLDITNLVEIRIVDDDTHTPETNTPEPQNININTSITKGIYHPLFDALRWAAARLSIGCWRVGLVRGG